MVSIGLHNDRIYLPACGTLATDWRPASHAAGNTGRYTASMTTHLSRYERSTSVLVLCTVALLSLGCHEMKSPEREEFVHKFLASIRDDTDFHRQYLRDTDVLEVERLRSLLSEPYEISRWDGPFMDDECYITLGTGQTALLHVGQKRRRPVYGAIHVYQERP